MTTRQAKSTENQNTEHEVLSVDECAEVLIDTVAQLRTEAGVADEQEISIYVTDVPLIRSALKQKGDYIHEKTNAVDVVRVNVEGGQPMPAHLPQRELHNLDRSPATIAIEES
ncbi:MAG: hypothetical protein R3E79_37200 [Caldilineaceae bacterium]